MIGFEMVIIGGIFIRSKSQHNFGKYQLKQCNQPLPKSEELKSAIGRHVDAATGHRLSPRGGGGHPWFRTRKHETDFCALLNLMQKKLEEY